MGKIITIIGNVGVGKTTAAKALCQAIGATYYGESHADRPFQQLAKSDQRFTFHNQVNYLLERAKQERSARNSPTIGIFDGGLDMDHFVFNRLFLHTGALTKAEYDQLNELYLVLRHYLPHPDRVIVLTADKATIQDRYLTRDRINLATTDDMSFIDHCLSDYINTILIDDVLFYDTTNEMIGFTNFIDHIKEQL